MKTITIDLGNGREITATAEAWLGALLVSLPRELRARVCERAGQAMAHPLVPLLGRGESIEVAPSLGLRRGKASR